MVSVLLLIAGLVRASPVWAHAHYSHSRPAAGEVLSTAPQRVEIFTDSEMRKVPGGNLLTVTGPNGERVDDGTTVVDDNDRQHFWVALQPELPNGRYVVSFQTLSDVDGDTDHGQFAFYIGAPPTAEQQRLDGTLTLTDTPSPANQASSAATAKTPPWPVILAASAGALIVLLAIAGVLWVLRSPHGSFR